MGTVVAPDARPEGKWHPNTPEDVVQKEERDKAVSAALEVVVTSARHGVVTLCASVAHIIRQKIRLEQQVADLEKKVTVLETNSLNSRGSFQAGGHGRSLPESPSSIRCGSAPPAFPSSPSRKLSGNENQIVQEACQTCESEGSQFECHICHHTRILNEGRVRREGDVVAVHESGERQGDKARSWNGFARGQAHSSTRSLNLCRVPSSASRFMRRKYSTISLRRVHRHASSSKGSLSGTLSHRSSSSSGSQEWMEDSSRRGSSSSKSYVVTVAEVYPPPSPPSPLPPPPPSPPSHTSSEGHVVKLLARKLASVMQEEDFEDQPLGPTPGHSPEHSSSHSPSPTTPALDGLCAPHPLAGCECVVCTQLTDPSIPLYVLSTSEGPLLPRGSTVLLRGDVIGTVLYFGHERNTVASRSGPPSCVTQPPSMTMGGPEGAMCLTTNPVGVTITIWPHDEGEMFVSLNDIVCQLDDEDIESHKAAHSLDTPEPPSQLTSPTGIHNFLQQRTGNQNIHPQQTDQCSLDSCIVEAQHAECLMIYDDCEKPKNSSFKVRESEDFKSVAIPVVSSSTTLEPDGVNDFDRRSTENNFWSDEELSELKIPITSYHSEVPFKLENEIIDNQHVNNRFFSEMRSNWSRNSERSSTNTEPEASLCNTSDSAISGVFKSRHRGQLNSETSTSQPTSLTGTDVESLHFGDTWDSGCCLKRDRWSSLSSEQHLSDGDYESSQGRSSWGLSLDRTFDSVWTRTHESIFPHSGPNADSYTEELSRGSVKYTSADSNLNTDSIDIERDKDLRDYIIRSYSDGVSKSSHFLHISGSEIEDSEV